MALGVERESEVAVGLGIGGIHAKGGARFGEGVLGILCPVKQVSKLAVRFGETGHQARRFRNLVERVVEPVFAAQDGSEDKMQRSLILWRSARIVAQQDAELVFGGIEVLFVNQSGNLCRRTRAGAGSVVVAGFRPGLQFGPRSRSGLQSGLRIRTLTHEALNQARVCPCLLQGAGTLPSAFWRGVA